MSETPVRTVGFKWDSVVRQNAANDMDTQAPTVTQLITGEELFEMLGEVMVGEVGIDTGRDPDTVRAADVLFISHERLKKASPEGFLDVVPELVVEIMSPTNKWEEVRRRVEEYLGIGVGQGMDR